mmetsp:Transcript_20501/g.37233  ORF Transcript_20501/g.37233 Transcript_20501/m.37233 type:complete len:219 (+) Transcript_20501:1442-2098(+)
MFGNDRLWLTATFKMTIVSTNLGKFGGMLIGGLEEVFEVRSMLLERANLIHDFIGDRTRIRIVEVQDIWIEETFFKIHVISRATCIERFLPHHWPVVSLDRVAVFVIFVVIAFNFIIFRLRIVLQHIRAIFILRNVRMVIYIDKVFFIPRFVLFFGIGMRIHWVKVMPFQELLVLGLRSTSQEARVHLDYFVSIIIVAVIFCYILDSLWKRRLNRLAG